VLNYITLPQLYKEIILARSLFSNKKLMTTSSFLAALNTLVSGNVGPLVKNLVLQDDHSLMAQYHTWELFTPNCQTLLDYPDLLKLPAGAAVERCTNLRSYTWDLVTVIKPIVYRALGQLQHLQSLHICYWAYDAEHGHFEVPPLPRLRELRVENYEPQRYRHDFSAVLLHATRLEVLKWHFHPSEKWRIRGVYVVKLFEQLRKARKLRLKSFSLHNGGDSWSGNTLREAIDVQSLTELSFVESTSLPRWDEHDQATLELTEGPWLMLMGQKLCLKSIQYDRLDQGYAHLLGSIIGLERMYLLDFLSYVQHDMDESRKVRDMCLDAIVTNHGATLRHLMLPVHWPLPTSWIARLFRTCPNITQLSLATECEPLEGMSILVLFLRKLWAIRVRFPEIGEGGDPAQVYKFMVGGDVEHHENQMEKDLAERLDFPELRYIGLGKLVWEFDEIYEKDGVRKRRVKRISREDVKDVEIWKMGTLKSGL
jgi:hypothetical protein